MKKLLCLIGGAMFMMNAFGQISELKIGDTVPDYKIRDILKGQSTPTNLNAFQDKLLILDFMNTGCSGCIAALPRLDSLQKRFKGKMQVFVVTKEGKERVSKFLNTNKKVKDLSIPFITEDILLNQMFPHQYISHEVWIYKGKVIAFTRAAYVQKSKIEEVLNGQEINWPVKRDFIKFKKGTPLVTLNKEYIPVTSLPEFKYYSTFTGHLNNILPYMKVEKDTIKRRIHFSCINYSIKDMLLRSYGLKINFPMSQIRVSDALKDKYLLDLSSTIKADWQLLHTFCYDALFPMTIDSATIFEKLRSDLLFYMGAKGYLLPENVNCWVIVDTTVRSEPFGDFKNYKEAQKNGFTEISELVLNVNKQFGHPPLISWANRISGMFMKLDMNACGDFVKFRNELNRYGLTLKLQKMELTMLHLE